MRTMAKVKLDSMGNRIGNWYAHAESTPRCKNGCGVDCYSVVRDDESYATIATEIATWQDALLLAGAEQLLRAAKQAVKQKGNWKRALAWAIADATDSLVSKNLRSKHA